MEKNAILQGLVRMQFRILNTNKKIATFMKNASSCPCIHALMLFQYIFVAYP